MKNDPRVTSGIESGVPLPDPIGFWRRLVLRWHGWLDRLTLRDDVKDGSHTHLSRWLEAGANHGITLVDRWERRTLTPLEKALASLPDMAVVETVPTVASEAPGDPRARVAWTELSRKAVEAEARNAAAQQAFRAAADATRELTMQHRNVRLAAAEARQQWIAAYDLRASVYARTRVARRGLRPAPIAIVPAYGALDARHRQETDEHGVHAVSIASPEGA